MRGKKKERKNVALFVRGERERVGASERPTEGGSPPRPRSRYRGTGGSVANVLRKERNGSAREAAAGITIHIQAGELKHSARVHVEWPHPRTRRDPRSHDYYVDWRAGRGWDKKWAASVQNDVIVVGRTRFTRLGC
jgi:hypothetical protein